MRVLRRPSDFDGSDYERKHDYERLKGQLARIVAFVDDGEWHTIQEIQDATGAPGPSVGAQLQNLRKERYGAYTVDKRIRGDRANGLYEYRLGAKGSWTPRKPAVLVRAEKAEEWCRRLREALEVVDEFHPLLDEYDDAFTLT